jgi:PAS domain S-box-containing protein
MNRIDGYWNEVATRSELQFPILRVTSMPEMEPKALVDLDEDAALRMLLEGTATTTGEHFFSALVENLSKALNTHGAMVTRCVPDKRQLKALAFRMDGQWIEDYTFDIPGTPCEQVIDQCCLIHFPDRLIDLFPGDTDLQQAGFVSYLGMPLQDVDGTILGHMAVVDRRPMTEESQVLAIFQIFAARAAAELQRLHRERELQDREEKLSRLVDSAMDAIIELDQNLKATRINVATEKVFRCESSQFVGRYFGQFITDESREKLTGLIRQLNTSSNGEPYLWIPGGLTARFDDGEEFQAEATLSRFEMQRQHFFTLILRNVNDRIEAERTIQSLTDQAEYLKEEIRQFHNFDEIVGESPSLLNMLSDVQQVAPTDATVLLLGETGTGKELIARAIHAASPRCDRPLIKVNCASIPATLMESEFFGHEKGAFTGASERRDGRFTLADGGTIFLDEIGELPIDLQAKLLRVLQEGEFEPVGSGRTRKVNVRVVAATNRDLQQAAGNGEFREDLYYRLNVFPLTLPPLRDRGDDVGLLAAIFAERFARKMGRGPVAISPECISRLKAYDWPGNVRELENVIERALITSRDGGFSLDRALPETSLASPGCTSDSQSDDETRIRTIHELQQYERDNIVRALDASAWKVSGEKGAAKLLGINPSTLNSRMKALGIVRPRD